MSTHKTVKDQWVAKYPNTKDMSYKVHGSANSVLATPTDIVVQLKSQDDIDAAVKYFSNKYDIIDGTHIRFYLDGSHIFYNEWAPGNGKHPEEQPFVENIYILQS